MDMKKENQRKKEYLQKYLACKREARRYECQLNEIIELSRSISCSQNNGMPGAHNKRDISDYIVKCEEIADKLKESRYALIMKFMEIQNKIEELQNVSMKEVLTFRYIRGWSWERIGEETGYSERQVHRIHGKALEALEISEGEMSEYSRAN